VSSQFYLNLVIWAVVGVVAFWKAGSSRWNGAGLALAFFINMALIHWMGALVCAVPWYTPLAGTIVNEQGFEMSTLGIVAFALGCFLVAPVLSPHLESSEMFAPPTPRIIRSFLVIGIVCYVAAAAGLAKIPSVGAVVQTGTYFVLVAICIGLWDASLKNQRKKFYGLLASTLLLPAFTVLTQGFLGYGVGYAILVLSVFITLYKRRSRLLLAALPLIFVGMSFYVTYMRDRAEIREQVWGGNTYGSRIGQLAETCRTIEWFNPHDLKHLERIDDRLNYNWLIGAAISHLQLTRNYADGETIWMGMLALIPRALWPGKTVAAGSSDLVSRYAGIKVAYGTSVGMGLIFEFFINFGAYGVFVGLLIIGFLVGFVDRKAGAALRSGANIDFAMWFIIGIALLNVGGSLVEIMPGLIIPVGITFGLRRWLHEETLPAESNPAQAI